MLNKPSFRIWDRAHKNWVESHVSGTHAFTKTYISLTGEVVKFSAGFPEHNEEPSFIKDSGACFAEGQFWDTKDRYIIQRGSGLKYRNGDEIFEGDIFNTIHARWKVEFIEGAFCAVVIWSGVENLKNIPLNGFFPENIIYLGNIFETPEKLEVVGLE